MLLMWIESYYIPRTEIKSEQIRKKKQVNTKYEMMKGMQKTSTCDFLRINLKQTRLQCLFNHP